jgi:hypothetical protein
MPWTVDVAPLRDPVLSAIHQHRCVHIHRPTKDGGTDELQWGAFIKKEDADVAAEKIAKALKGRDDLPLREIEEVVRRALGLSNPVPRE